jgi:hypothetical protein
MRYIIYAGIIVLWLMLLNGCVVNSPGTNIVVVGTQPNAKAQDILHLIERIEGLISQLDRTGEVKDTAELKDVLTKAKGKLVKANSANGKEVNKYDKAK